MPTTPTAPHPHHSPPNTNCKHQRTHPTINYAAFSNLGFSVVWSNGSGLSAQTSNRRKPDDSDRDVPSCVVTYPYPAKNITDLVPCHERR